MLLEVLRHQLELSKGNVFGCDFTRLKTTTETLLCRLHTHKIYFSSRKLSFFVWLKNKLEYLKYPPSDLILFFKTASGRLLISCNFMQRIKSGVPFTFFPQMFWSEGSQVALVSPIMTNVNSQKRNATIVMVFISNSETFTCILLCFFCVEIKLCSNSCYCCSL